MTLPSRDMPKKKCGNKYHGKHPFVTFYHPTIKTFCKNKKIYNHLDCFVGNLSKKDLKKKKSCKEKQKMVS